MTDKSILIIGAGGHGKVIADLAECTGWSVVGFLDPEQQGEVGAWPVIGNDSLFSPDLAQHVIVAVGNGAIRARLQAEFLSRGAKLPTLVSPHAVFSRYSTAGPGSVVLPGACINAFTTLGDGVVVNTGAIVEHDCVVGDFAQIGPGATVSGGVRIGSRTLIGAGASIILGIEIGSGVTVAAGAVVTKNLPDGARVAGVPAQPF